MEAVTLHIKFITFTTDYILRTYPPLNNNKKTHKGIRTIKRISFKSCFISRIQSKHKGRENL